MPIYDGITNIVSSCRWALSARKCTVGNSASRNKTVQEIVRTPEHVRIIDDDTPAQPLHITRKKNRLAMAARHPNLCIMHDRVLLPVNFMAAIRRFGDDFPLTGFQSFWFADTWQAVPRRYSDFYVTDHLPPGLSQENRPCRNILPDFEDMVFRMQHPRRATPGVDYLTGSLYLCKRSVWQHLPQNEAFYWAEYEDVEQGIRAAREGIPSRINPWSLTQTQQYRSIFHTAGRAAGMDISGNAVTHRAPQELLGFPRRASLSVSESEARRRLTVFAMKYIGDSDLVHQAPARLRGLCRYRLLKRMLKRSSMTGHSLAKDWFYLVLCESPVPSELAALQAIQNSPLTPSAKKRAWLHHPSLLRQIYNNPFGSPFLPDNIRPACADWRRKTGSLISALYLKFVNPHTAFRLPLRELWHTLYHSVSQCITVYHSVSQCITVYHSVSQCITVYHSVSQCITVYHSASREHI
ncbi:hypothetical protein HWQ18_10830 [Enterobacter ludwigii]|uniref:hypothetical protein n=1 Tax=Enterobacter ludwigii TaxID=299767 RepID=UPI00159C9E8E|nr:hypothetical protein [Enterobacter ludwigii]QLA04978.1 hypothetical protein HWQ18_10830 [Enterobacter ludwigii]